MARTVFSEKRIERPEKAERRVARRNKAIRGAIFA